MDMPSSGLALSSCYAELLSQVASDSSLHRLTDEDALLLLVALWSDVVHVYRLSCGGKGTEDSRQPDSQSELLVPRHSDPFAPLSPAFERKRLQDKLLAALVNWDMIFAATVAGDVLTLYHYCRMIATCPEVLSLPSLVGYSPARNAPRPTSRDVASQFPVIGDEVRDLAMLVLAHATVKSGDPAIRVQIWLPVVVFQAALAVWAHSTQSTVCQERRPRILASFIRTLNALPWPCCKQMASILQRCSER